MTNIINDYLNSISLVKSRVDKITLLLSKETDDKKIKYLSKRRLLLYEEIREMNVAISKLRKLNKSGDSYGEKN